MCTAGLNCKSKEVEVIWNIAVSLNIIVYFTKGELWWTVEKFWKPKILFLAYASPYLGIRCLVIGFIMNVFICHKVDECSPHDTWIKIKWESMLNWNKWMKQFIVDSIYETKASVFWNFALSLYFLLNFLAHLELHWVSEHQHILFFSRHCLELMIGDKVLPFNMTVYQAVKQYGQVRNNY